MEMLLSGNEALARGVYEFGGEFASAYPGTPSTEILQTIGRFFKDDVYAEWAINEKVALEVAVGARFGVASTISTAPAEISLVASPDSISARRMGAVSSAATTCPRISQRRCWAGSAAWPWSILPAAILPLGRTMTASMPALAA